MVNKGERRGGRRQIVIHEKTKKKVARHMMSSHNEAAGPKTCETKDKCKSPQALEDIEWSTGHPNGIGRLHSDSVNLTMFT